MELAEELAEPGGLSDGIGHGPILGLGAGAGHRVLPLRGPSEQVGAEENAMTRHGLACIRAARPVGVEVSNEL